MTWKAPDFDGNDDLRGAAGIEHGRRAAKLAHGLSEVALDEDLARDLCGRSLPRMLEAVGSPEPSCLGELAHRLYGFD